jgi:hypothetical protein
MKALRISGTTDGKTIIAGVVELHAHETYFGWRPPGSRPGGGGARYDGQATPAFRVDGPLELEVIPMGGRSKTYQGDYLTFGGNEVVLHSGGGKRVIVLPDKGYTFVDPA